MQKKDIVLCNVFLLDCNHKKYNSDAHFVFIRVEIERLGTYKYGFLGMGHAMRYI